MKKFDNVILVSDMDGTLLNSKGIISKKNKEAIINFIENGGLFTIATGRDERSLEKLLDMVPTNLPSIVYNGAEIFDYNKNDKLYFNYLDNITKELTEIMEEFHDLGVEIYSENKIYIIRENKHVRDHNLRDSFIPYYSSDIESIKTPWKKVILVYDPNDIHKIKTFLDNKDYKFKHFYSQPDFIELLNKNTSKATALKNLINIIKKTNKKIIAVGDNFNDLEMIKFADVGIAVSNAEEIIKESADICCCNSDESAIAEVIEWIKSDRINTN